MRKILVTGGTGYIGPELIAELLKGNLEVTCLIPLLSLRKWTVSRFQDNNNFKIFEADIRDQKSIASLIQDSSIDTIFHLASLVSVNGEINPEVTWDINYNGLKNILDSTVGRDVRIFWPSSISVYGPDTPKTNTSENAKLNPITEYGKTKMAGEKLCREYYQIYGADIRMIRYPGNITAHDIPIGGTTGYATEMLHAAVKKEPYRCYLRQNTFLPLIYLSDTIDATMKLMESDKSIVEPTAYNIHGMSFSPEMLEQEIRKYIPDFVCNYESEKSDPRQKIADSWPNALNDSRFRSCFHWKPEFDLDSTVKDMIAQLEIKYHAA